MVGVARIELATPAMSTQCSTTELHAHTGNPPGCGGSSSGPLKARPTRRKPCHDAKRRAGPRTEHPVDLGPRSSGGTASTAIWLPAWSARSAAQPRRAGDEHDFDVGVDRARLLRKLDPVHLGHDDIAQQQIIACRLEQRNRLRAASDRVDIIADSGKRALQILTHRRVVFGQENSDHGKHHGRNARL